MEDGNVAVRDIDSLTDGTAAKVRFIGAQTCVVSGVLTVLPPSPASPGASRAVSTPAGHLQTALTTCVASRCASQARAPKLRTHPETLRRSEVLFLHFYLVVEYKNGKKYVSLVRQDEAREEILSKEMRSVWAKVDRTKLKKAIYAPVPRRFGKTAEEQMEESMIEGYNEKRVPREWLSLGKDFGNTIAPSLSDLSELCFEVASASPTRTLTLTPRACVD